MIKKFFLILIIVSCCLLLTACSRRQNSDTATPLNFSGSSKPASASTSDFNEQPPFNLDIPADNIVELSFSRIGGNGAELFDTTKDKKTIGSIIQKINQTEFIKSRLSNEEIQIKDGTIVTIRIYYQDGLCKEIRNRSGWYQYTDSSEQWLEQKGLFDLNKFIADEMCVQLWG